MIFLQVAADSLSETAQAATESLSALEPVTRGGFMIIPIGICLIAAIYLFVDRLMALNKASEDPSAFLKKIKGLLVKGDINGAKALCSQTDSPIARMIEKGVSRIGSPLRNIEASIENIGRLEVFKLEKNLSILGTLAGITPVMGFLGTVIGIAEIFVTISQEQVFVSPSILYKAIYLALITTIAGLIVGLLTYIFYNLLVTRLKSVVHKMEYTSIDFLDLLQEPRQ